MENLQDLKGKQVVVLGVGNVLKSDDAVGSRIAEELLKLVNNPKVLVIDCGLAPENFLSKIVEHDPDYILLIDTASFGGEPGSTFVIELDATSEEFHISNTHKLSLKLLANILHRQLTSTILLLGIQPASVEFGDELSPVVASAKDKIVAELTKLLNASIGAASA